MSLFENIFGLKEKDGILLKGTDQINRPIELIKSGNKFSVFIDSVEIKCKNLKEAELEFYLRLNDANRNL